MLWWQCIVLYNTVIIIEKHQEPYGNTIDTNQMIYETKFKVKITGNTPNTDDKKNVGIAVPLKYLSNFWRTLEILLINYEINLILISCYFFCEWKRIFQNKKYKNLCSSCNFINSRLYKTITSDKLIFRFLNWSKFSRSQWIFCFIIWKGGW